MSILTLFFLATTIYASVGWFLVLKSYKMDMKKSYEDGWHDRESDYLNSIDRIIGNDK